MSPDVALALGGSALSMVLSLAFFVVMFAVMLVATLIPIGLSLFFVFRSLRGMRGNIKNGRSAPAELVSVSRTGLSINGVPQVRAQLRVHPVEGPPFTGSTTFMLSPAQAGALQPGNLLHVQYDPAKPSEVAMVGAIGQVEAYAPPQAAAAPPLVPMLHRLLASQLLTASLQRAPEVQGVIVTATELGLHCSGKSPFMVFEVAVEAGGEPATVKAEGVVSQLSVDRYQAGKSVWVRLAPGAPRDAVLVRAA